MKGPLILEPGWNDFFFRKANEKKRKTEKDEHTQVTQVTQELIKSSSSSYFPKENPGGHVSSRTFCNS
jgi:hypothetical protein